MLDSLPVFLFDFNSTSLMISCQTHNISNIAIFCDMIKYLLNQNHIETLLKKQNHHMYKEKATGIWYFQKKVRGVDKPYKFSLETKAVGEARQKRDDYLSQIRQCGYIKQIDLSEIKPLSDAPVFGEVAQQWAKIIKSRVAETTFHNYQRVMNNPILPCFGNMPIASITSLQIEVFISKAFITKADSKRDDTPSDYHKRRC